MSSGPGSTSSSHVSQEQLIANQAQAIQALEALQAQASNSKMADGHSDDDLIDAAKSAEAAFATPLNGLTTDPLHIQDPWQQGRPG
eukprot:1375504-Karenia_brevis.AAC.1